MKNSSDDFAEPFNMRIPPKKQNPFLMPLIWLGSYLLTRKNHLKIERNLRGIKPPFLVVATHQGFSDYYIAPLALFPHRANYVSDVEGYAAFGEWLYRSIGCIGKRRFVPDVNVLLNMKKSIRMKQSVVVYPESRHCNAGTTSYLPDYLGKLAKYLNVPVVILSTHGSYLESPLWDEEYSRRAPIKAKLECLYTKDEMLNVNEEEIQEKVAKALQYDEYAWQQENKISLKRSRANGLHKVLYRCPRCNGMDFVNHDTERDMMLKNSAVMSAGAVNQDVQCDIMMGSIMMTSDEEGVTCEVCDAKWKLTPLGELEYADDEESGSKKTNNSRDGDYINDSSKANNSKDGDYINDSSKADNSKNDDDKVGSSKMNSGIYKNERFYTDKDKDAEHDSNNASMTIPAWYEWERDCAIDDWNNSSRKFTYSVHIEALPNSKGFIDCGSGTLELNQDAFLLTFGGQRIVFSHRSRESVQTEYNYKGKGMCIVLSTQDNCYYIYSEERHFNPTWMQFVAEYLYQQSKKFI